MLQYTKRTGFSGRSSENIVPKRTNGRYEQGYEQPRLLSWLGGRRLLRERRAILDGCVEDLKRREGEDSLTPEQLAWINNRWKELVLLFLKNGQKDRRRFLNFRYAAAVGALIIPVLASFNAASGTPSDLVRYSTLAVSLAVAAATASQVFRFGPRWRLDSEAAEAMESAGWRFQTRVGSSRSSERRFESFFDEVEKIVRIRAEKYRAEVITSTDPGQPSSEEAAGSPNEGQTG